MSAYLVSVVVAGPDAEARQLAESIAELAATAAEVGEGETDTHVGDPVRVVR